MRWSRASFPHCVDAFKCSHSSFVIKKILAQAPESFQVLLQNLNLITERNAFMKCEPLCSIQLVGARIQIFHDSFETCTHTHRRWGERQGTKRHKGEESTAYRGRRWHSTASVPWPSFASMAAVLASAAGSSPKWMEREVISVWLYCIPSILTPHTTAMQSY